MSEGTGWGGQFHLHNGTALTKLLRVTAIDFPEDTVDEEDVTTLESPGRRKEFIPTLIDGGSFTVEMNYIPGSITDTLCRAAATTRDVRAWKIVIPDEAGVAERQISGSGYVQSYKPDPLTAGGAKKATLTIRTTGAQTEAAAA